MSVFTDEDLKRLKESFQGDSPFVDDGVDSTVVLRKTMEALLARLEAAEAHIRACEEFHGFDKNDMPFVEAWLKSKGASNV